jgi:glycine hydroxymethyltransferase
MVPFDDKSPFVTSGIVLELQLSLRGLVEEDMETIVELIDKVLMNHTNEDISNKWLMKLTKNDERKSYFVF